MSNNRDAYQFLQIDENDDENFCFSNVQKGRQERSFGTCSTQISNHTVFLVQFEINVRKWTFQKAEIVLVKAARFEKLTREN